ncbi:MAG: baseplate J/gp47 family protein [Deltaproteobacteria bacterium]|nr:baseplate J/gp47 family protein [Deltaproteobacteria bacterium]
MPFDRPTLQQLDARIQADLASRLTGGGALLRRSVLQVLARVMAGAAHSMHGHLEWAGRQVTPDTADEENLILHAQRRGVYRREAVSAEGQATVTGEDGSEIGTDAVWEREDGIRYLTVTGGTITDGEAGIAVRAEEGGAAGNASAGTKLRLVSPVEGIQEEAQAADGGITGGIDAETASQLLDRLLARLRRPPQGGAIPDYEIWARQVAGVGNVWVIPAMDGPGTVGVTFTLLAGEEGDGDLVPDSEMVEAVQAHIAPLAPVTAEVTVFAPTPDIIDFEIALTPDTDAVKAAVTQQLEDLIRRKRAARESRIYLTEIHTAIGLAQGEITHTLSGPSEDYEAALGHIPVMGTVTWT